MALQPPAAHLEPLRVHYYGKDIKYFNNLKERIKKAYQEKVEMQFTFLNDRQNLVPKLAFKEILEQKFNVLFLDFSVNIDSMAYLAKLIRTDNNTRHISTTALHTRLDFEKTSAIAMLNGVRINHIKSAEFGDVVYDAIALLNHDNVIEQSHALARFQSMRNMHVDLRLAYATDTFYKVETNLQFPEGKQLELESHPLSNTLQNDNFFVSKVEETDLYYNTKFGIRLNYMYLPGYNMDGSFSSPEDAELDDQQKALEDKPVYNPFADDSEKMAEDADDDMKSEIEKQRKEYEDLINAKKNKHLARIKFLRLTEEDKQKKLKDLKSELKDWVENSQGRVKPKKTKILVLDREMYLLQNADTNLDELPYSFNMQTRLMSSNIEIIKKLPNIIVFVYEPPPEGALLMREGEVAKEGDGANRIDPLEFNGGETLGRMMNTIRNIESYEPIVIVFNAKHKSETLQQKLDYKKIISNIGNPDLMVIRRMARMFEESEETKEMQNLEIRLKNLKAQDAMKWSGKKPTDLQDKRVYFKGDDLNILLRTAIPIEVIAMSESQIVFTSEMQLPPYTVFHFNIATKMLLTVVPHRTGSEFHSEDKVYRGLINGVGELEKKLIRQYINKVFFTELDEKQKKEKEDFNALNRAKAKAEPTPPNPLGDEDA